MKTFEEALTEEVKSIKYYGTCTNEFKEGFDEGANWAAQSPELINEILTKYHEWAINISAESFDRWQVEEGDHEKINARIRKEFIDYLFQKKINEK